ADFPGAFETSAVTGQGLEDLTAQFTALLADRVKKLIYRVPQSRGDISGLIHREGKVLATDYEGNDIILTAIVPNSLEGQLAEFLEDES
ncbi:GTPase HflX, partial [bacterium]|nr:GTPase HflX [bacterium]